LLTFHNTHFGDKLYTATDMKQLFNLELARTNWDMRVPVSHTVVALHRKWNRFCLLSCCNRKVVCVVTVTIVTSCNHATKQAWN